MTKHPQRSLMLSPEEWERWEALAIALNAIPSQGPQTTNPTWRTVAKWIGQGKLEVTPAEEADTAQARPVIYDDEEGIAQGDKWRFSSATANLREGINVYRKDGSIEWYIRCEAPGDDIAYRLHHVYKPA